ncbi:hypothetical protein [Dehalobacter sp. 14DCB1]|uniref:hypothetical protein n=1 Tax=Dehalobacter sp. 14DCB1 TaxID=2070227 RepID=UPI0010540728|nr:hypothetical protein [Dehalobacter sp. 14DCB1]TCX53796.1 hypothetical protein C1I36_03435 [Dehalobacter sp. 14DCB1]
MMFQKGDKVKLKTNTIIGTVIESTNYGWCAVEWENGQIETSEEILLEGIPTPISYDSPKSFQISDRVRIDPNNPQYHEFLFQHKGSIGTICEDSIEDDWIAVKWDNGYENSYLIKALLHVNEEIIDQPKKNESYQYDLPLLPGQRVMFNPNNTDYEYYKDVVGYIIHIDNIRNLLTWKKNKSSLLSHICYVNIDDDIAQKTGPSKICTFEMKDLIPIDAPTKTVTAYHLSDGNQCQVLDGDQYYKDYLDTKIIKHKRLIDKCVVYDDKWRNDLITKIIQS